MKCKNCNLELKEKSKNIFCSKSCSATYNNARRLISDSQKQKVKNTFKQKYGNKFCIVCSKELLIRKRKTCSNICLNSLQKSYSVPVTSGGYRKGSGRGKHGWYDNIYFDSTYELAFYIFCKNKNIKIERCNDVFEYINIKGETRKYYPDFRVNGKITEIKGYYTPEVDLKIKAVNEPIDIFYKKDLKEIFKYVEKHTGLKIKKLYLFYKNSPTGI
jgi:hypothetical protein